MIAQPGLCQTWSETRKTSFLTTRLTLFQLQKRAEQMKKSLEQQEKEIEDKWKQFELEKKQWEDQTGYSNSLENVKE